MARRFNLHKLSQRAQRQAPVREFSRRHGFSRPLHVAQIFAWLAFVLFCTLTIAISFSLVYPGPFIVFILLLPLAFLFCICKFWTTILDPGVPTAKEKQGFYTTKRPYFQPGITGCHVITVREDDRTVGDCSVCEVEVTIGTKHCRQCNKCIAGWDHHCLWLNNCIGEVNLGSFMFLIRLTLACAFITAAYHAILLVLFFTCAPCFHLVPPAVPPPPNSMTHHSACGTSVHPFQPNAQTTTPPPSSKTSFKEYFSRKIYFFGLPVPGWAWFVAVCVNLSMNLPTAFAAGSLVSNYNLKSKYNKRFREGRLAAAAAQKNGGSPTPNLQMFSENGFYQVVPKKLPEIDKPVIAGDGLDSGIDERSSSGSISSVSAD